MNCFIIYPALAANEGDADPVPPMDDFPQTSPSPAVNGVCLFVMAVLQVDRKYVTATPVKLQADGAHGLNARRCAAACKRANATTPFRTLVVSTALASLCSSATLPTSSASVSVYNRQCNEITLAYADILCAVE
jgi:hypothetical protein